MRHKLIKLIMPIALMVGLMAMPAKAEEAGWGIAIGVKAHSTSVDVSGSEREGNRSNNTATANNGEELHKATTSKDIDIASAFIEFPVRSAGGSGFLGITTGLEWIPGESTIANKSRTDTDIDTKYGETEATGTSKTYVAKANVSNILTVYIEPTLYVTESIGLYAKGGAQGLQLDTLESITHGINSAAYPDKVMMGGVLGYGIRYTAPFGLLVKLEYTETNFKPYSATSDTGNGNKIKAELDTQSTTIALGWQF